MVLLVQVLPQCGIGNIDRCGLGSDCQYQRLWLPQPQRSATGVSAGANAACEHAEEEEGGEEEQEEEGEESGARGELEQPLDHEQLLRAWRSV